MTDNASISVEVASKRKIISILNSRQDNNLLRHINQASKFCTYQKIDRLRLLHIFCLVFSWKTRCLTRMCSLASTLNVWEGHGQGRVATKILRRFWHFLGRTDSLASPPPQGRILPIETKCLMYVNAQIYGHYRSAWFWFYRKNLSLMRGRAS